MRVRVRLGEPFWRSVGKRELEFEMEAGRSVGELLSLLRRRYPELAREMDESPPRIFVDSEEPGLGSILMDGCQVRFAWPIAGG